ncbi:MAG: hypothetical protein RLZZ352_384 [Pseudomonadota bacterium]|jgi:ribonuclease T1
MALQQVRWLRWFSVLVLMLATLGTVTALHARGLESDALSVTHSLIPLSALPPEGQTVMRQIQEGGPFRYDKDGTNFGNRERLLPMQTRGYYREYTVPTPGLSHRGARRIVCGGTQPRQPEACYYTEDHYSSFRRIVH